MCGIVIHRVAMQPVAMLARKAILRLDPRVPRVLRPVAVKKKQRGALIRVHCDRVGVPLPELAQEVGLSLDALRKIDSGRREPLLPTALRIARALGIEVEDIFGSP